MKKILLFLILIFSVLLYLRANNIHQDEFNFTLPPGEYATNTSGFLENFEFNIPRDSSDNLITDPSGWLAIQKESGIAIYKEENRSNNYLFIIDPSAKRISIHNTYATLADHWNQTSNPVCVFNGGFYEPYGAPSLPLIENYNILPGAVTEKHITRILYIDNSQLTLADIKQNSDVRVAEFAITGINPHQFYGSDVITNRTVIGINNNLLYLSLTTDRAIDVPDQKYRDIDTIIDMYSRLGIPKEKMIILDGGGSTQGRCFGQDYLVNDRVLGSTIVVTNP